MSNEWIKSRLASLVYGDRISIVPRFLRANWPQRMFLKRFLVELRIDCVLDVGANGGQYGAELRRIGYRGRIFSFEPDPTAFARLQQRVAGDDQWHALNLALGRSAGRYDFNIMAVSLFNSFRSPSVEETDRFAGANEVAEVVSVEVARLSDVIPELARRYGPGRIFLKMDTQGFDAEVFAGGQEVHRDILGLQSEIGIKRLYAGVDHWTDQLRHYQESGFDLAGMFAVNPEEREVLELDCYFRAANAS